MILLFFVILVLYICVWLRNRSRTSNISASRLSEECLAVGKTNATLEQRLVDQHMKEGICFQESYELAQKEIKDLGFEPCIPMKAYFQMSECETSIVGENRFNDLHGININKYDSEFIRRRQRQVESDIKNWYMLHPDKEWPYKYDDEVYDIPKGFGKSIINDKRNSFYSSRIDIGTQVYHPLYGMMTIKKYANVDRYKTSGNYILEQSGTGKIIKLKIGDPLLKQL